LGGGFGYQNEREKPLQTSLGFSVLQGGEVLVAKQKGKNIQTSLGIRVFEGWAGFCSKVKGGGKLTSKSD
jgi:hypothetical protein